MQTLRPFHPSYSILRLAWTPHGNHGIMALPGLLVALQRKLPKNPGVPTVHWTHVALGRSWGDPCQVDRSSRGSAPTTSGPRKTKRVLEQVGDAVFPYVSMITCLQDDLCNPTTWRKMDSNRSVKRSWFHGQGNQET
ncbi:unnamed protein product [Durusdinium trenchii]|uniref:Uncharacterized protein n=1 Tax=Durusdinium trenchii TaxID=1381693 RepID=A0ABP0L370_9DINO